MEGVALMQAAEGECKRQDRRLAAGAPALAWAAPLAGLLALAVASPAWGAPPVETPGPRNYLQRSYTKIRPGSMLRGENGAPTALPPDLRSAAGKRRDQDVLKHFARLAELDVIDDMAEKRKDVSLQENVEEVPAQRDGALSRSDAGTAQRQLAHLAWGASVRFCKTMRYVAAASVLWLLGCGGNPDAQVPQDLREAAAPETTHEPGGRIDYASDLEQTKYVYRKVVDQARKEITSVKIARARLSMLDGQIEQERELMR